MGYPQNNLSMKVTFLVLALALAVSAKTRRGPLPQIIREKFHDDLKTNEPRIVGGDTISISERPFQVGLEYSFFDFTFCGGSLIASAKVLTAAHCCDGEAADDLKVRVGTDRNAEGGSTHMVSKVTMNPGYSSSTVANDACVLTLAESVTDSNAGTVSLATSGSFSDGDMFEVSGWGTTSEGGDTSSTLRMVLSPTLMMPLAIAHMEAMEESSLMSCCALVKLERILAKEILVAQCPSMANMSVLFLGEL